MTKLVSHVQLKNITNSVPHLRYIKKQSETDCNLSLVVFIYLNGGTEIVIFSNCTCDASFVIVIPYYNFLVLLQHSHIKFFFKLWGSYCFELTNINYQVVRGRMKDSMHLMLILRKWGGGLSHLFSALRRKLIQARSCIFKTQGKFHCILNDN